MIFSAPQEGENYHQNNKSLAELQARKNAIDIVSAICRVATDVLRRAQFAAEGQSVSETFCVSVLTWIFFENVYIEFLVGVKLSALS